MKKILFLIPLIMLLPSCSNYDTKTPLGWCLWEIHKHEDYDCKWSYSYNDIYNYDAKDNVNLHAYYITVFLDDKIGEWYCYIECEHKSNFDKAVGKSVYSTEEITLIDCDLAREEYYV